MKKFNDLDEYEKEIVKSLKKIFPDQSPKDKAAKKLNNITKLWRG